MAVAGKDVTALFDKHHHWVNAHGMMAACCVGKLANVGAAPTLPAAAPTPPAAAPTPPPAAPSTVPRQRRGITWDEPAIQQHADERGVLYGASPRLCLHSLAPATLCGNLAHSTRQECHRVLRLLLAGTMKCNQVETPFLYLDEANPEGDSAAINSKYLMTHVPQAEQPSGEHVPGPYQMPVADLQHALGLLETMEEGIVNSSRPRWADNEAEFGMQRREYYSGEANVAALSNGLPGTPPPSLHV